MYLKTKLAFIVLLTLMMAGLPSLAAAQGTVVADVSIKNGGILSQQNNKITIGFDLVNGDTAQAGVRYGVLLVSKTGTYIADEKVFDEALNLAAHSTTHREVIYTAPSVLSGQYAVYLESKNGNNLPFDMRPIGSVTLAVGIRGVYLDPATCYLQIDGDKSGKHYTLSQVVAVSASDTVRLTCSGLNQTANTVTVTPVVETHYYSQFGAKAETTNVDNTPISLASNTQKAFSVLLPKGTKPQLYSARFAVSGMNVASNAVYPSYVISGVQASVQQVTLDKQSYVKGETGTLSLTWSAIAGNFSQAGNKTNAAPAVSIKATITNNGAACANPINQALTRDPKNAFTTIPFTVTKNCKQPVVSIELTDSKGNVLDQKTIDFKPTQEAPMFSRTTLLIAIALLIVIAIAGVVMMRKKRHAQTVTE